MPKSIPAIQTFQIPTFSGMTNQTQPSTQFFDRKLIEARCEAPLSSDLFSAQYSLNFLKLKELVVSDLLAGSTPTMFATVKSVSEDTLRKIKAVEHGVEVFLKIGDFFQDITSSCECDDLCQEMSLDALFLTQLLGGWMVSNIPKLVL